VQKRAVLSQVRRVSSLLPPPPPPGALVIKQLFLALEKKPVKKSYHFFFIEQIVIIAVHVKKTPGRNLSRSHPLKEKKKNLLLGYTLSPALLTVMFLANEYRK
jgi:hypothetical protein